MNSPQPGRGPEPLVGIGYRHPIHDWTVAHLESFDVLELTIDHFLVGGPRFRSAATELAGRIPLVAHGVGLSLGSAVRPDPVYLDQVAGALDALGIPSYSEHLAFTKMPGLDLANLLPLPRTEEAAEIAIRNIGIVRAHIPGPMLLENITYYFQYPESAMGEAEFLTLVCRETGCDILLDVENIRCNSRNHGHDARRFVDSLPAGSVKGIHVAGGSEIDGTVIDSHDHPVPDDTVDILGHVLRRQRPETIILERDRRLRVTDDLLPDIARIRTVVENAAYRSRVDGRAKPTPTSA